MVDIKKEGVLLESTKNEFENQAVLNPTVFQQGNTLHLFYRAVKEGNYSSIGYCRLEGPLNIVERSNNPLLFPEHEYEKHGVEDPRIVFLDGIYYLFYTAYDGKNALVAYATSGDLKNWKKHGIISPIITYEEAANYFRESKLKERYFFFESYFQDVIAKDVLLWEKDSFIFPVKINNKFALIHRINPDIQIIYFDNFQDLKKLDYWKNYLKDLGNFVLLEPEFGYESRGIGAGAPLIETDKGWLMIFHSVEDSNAGKIYHASVALLDKNQPFNVIGRLKKPLISPTETYEKEGDVNNVIFPTGSAIFGEKLYIYYGVADKRIAVASVNLNELLFELLTSKSEIDIEVGWLAGHIFKAAFRGEKSVSQLKNILKADETRILMAIGWLARENRIHLWFEGNDLIIRTKNDFIER